MPEYYVEWDIDIDANSPREAAEKVLQIMRDPQSRATLFRVTDDKGNKTNVDLEEEEGFVIPLDIRAKAIQETRDGLRLNVSPQELVEQMDRADQALNGDSNDAEHDALVAIREWLSDVFERHGRDRVRRED